LLLRHVEENEKCRILTVQNNLRINTNQCVKNGQQLYNVVTSQSLLLRHVEENENVEF